MEDVKFQCMDWRFFEDIEDVDDKDDYYLRYRIDIFGRTSKDETIHVEVENFCPYFFVEIPSGWKNATIEKFITTLKSYVYTKERTGLIKYKTVSKCSFSEFTAYKKFNFIQLIFQSLKSFRAYERVLKKPFKFANNGVKKYKLYESNIEPFLRCMHIQDLDACGWGLLKKNNYQINDAKPSRCDIDVIVDWKNIESIKDNHIMPFKIGSFDIECTSIDGNFPDPERPGDKIIQIGTTFNRYGEDECFLKHIITLGSCAPIDGVEVEYYKTEEQVLKAWTKLIQRTDPDILTGYNIFGFDWKYMHKRAEFLGIEREFSYLGRLKAKHSEFISKDLSSSALGENFLTFYDNVGRVTIDLMKVVQKDYKLASYKLDSVAADFIREDIKKITIEENKSKFSVDSEEIEDVTSVIHTKSTYGLKESQYISIHFNDGLSDNVYRDGHKFRVLSLSNNTIRVQGLLNGEEMDTEKFKCYWCQAKDDVPPNEIFRLQKGDAKDRARIAKYCVMDCVLVNKLITKLQVLTNNIGMANVCSVPLSYLFLRGQGVKIYSLVSKVCRQKDHLIPTLNRKPKFDEKGVQKLMSIMMRRLIEEYYPDTTELMYSRQKRDKMIDISRIMLEQILKTAYVSDKIRIKPVFKNSKYVQRNNKNTSELTDKDVTDAVESILKSELFKHRVASSSGVSDIKDEDNYIMLSKSLQSVLDDMNDDGDNGLYRGKKADKKRRDKETDMEQALRQLGVEEDHGYEGATVFHPKIGVHFEPIPVLDYASLYPKSMIHRNISHECLVTNDEYMNLDGYVYRRVIFKNSDGSETHAVFAQKTDGSKGILPEILDYLLVARSRTKKERDAETDPFKWSIKEGLQLAYKITANSLYGQTGAPTSPIHNKKVAASTTATGREMLTFAKEFNESIFKHMIELIQKKKFKTYRERMNKLFDGELLEFDISVEFKKLLTDSPDLIIKVDDDRFASDKKMPYKTRKQFIDYFKKRVQDILEGIKVNPEVIYGDSVPEDCPIIIKKGNKNPEIITISSLANNYYLYNNDKEAVDLTDIYAWTETGWTRIHKIIRHTTQKKIFRVSSGDSYVDVTEDHSLVNSFGQKIRPEDITSETRLMTSYPKEKLSISSINALKDAKKYSEILINNKESSDRKIEVVDISAHYYRYTDRITVYDLETDNHHFQAGVGDIIVHNTDSVFLRFNMKDEKGEVRQDHDALKKAIDLGVLCGQFINKVMPYPHDLEYEKTFWPFIILTKKRYVGNLYEYDPDNYKQKSMGIVLKRRDNAPIVKIICGGVVRSILQDKSAQKAVEFTQTTLDRILSGKYPVDKFVITKTLKSTYKDRSRIMHAVLADRMADRDPGNKPQSNDRLSYVYIRTDHLNQKNLLQGEKIEHIDYVIRENLEIDFLFYITNQIMKPTVQFLSLLIRDPEKLFQNYIMIEENRRKKKSPVMSCFDYKQKTNQSYDNIIIENEIKSKSIKKKKKIETKKIEKEILNANITIDDLI